MFNALSRKLGRQGPHGRCQRNRLDTTLPHYSQSGQKRTFAAVERRVLTQPYDTQVGGPFLSARYRFNLWERNHGVKAFQPLDITNFYR